MEVPTTTSVSAGKIKETMEDLSKSLAALQKQAAAIASEEPPVAKRPRKVPPKQEVDAPMAEEPGDGSLHFGSAGCK